MTVSAMADHIQYCREQLWWDKAIMTITSIESYEQMVSALFGDGIMNSGRLLVLELFTHDLCTQHPDLSHEVWTRYKKISGAYAAHSASVI